MHEKRVTVLFLWKPADELFSYLRDAISNRSDIDLIFPESPSDGIVRKYAPLADIVIGWRPDTELLNNARRMRLFINPGAGVQHLITLFRDLNRSKDIVLVNGHGNAYFTAQHAVALLLALTNKIIDHHTWMKNGRWRTGDGETPSIPLRGTHIGLLGYGAVNSTVHGLLSGFDLCFSICRRRGANTECPGGNLAGIYSPEHLNAFLDQIEVLIVAVPLTNETRGLLGTPELDRLGRSGLLVNVSRGPVVDESALFHSLSESRISGAAIDVWYDYRPEPDAHGFKFPAHFPFHTLHNVVLSPHRAASPFSDLQRWDEVIENITRFADGREDFLNVVDLEHGY